MAQAGALLLHEFRPPTEPPKNVVKDGQLNPLLFEGPHKALFVARKLSDRRKGNPVPADSANALGLERMRCKDQ